VSGDQHDFVVWLRENHGKDDNPLGDFAREFAPDLPSTGTHDELRRRLYYTADDWALDIFDAAWAEYERTLAELL
jgi:hypothetical protein